MDVTVTGASNESLICGKEKQSSKVTSLSLL